MQVYTNENHSKIQLIPQLWLNLLSTQIRSNIYIRYINKRKRKCTLECIIITLILYTPQKCALFGLTTNRKKSIKMKKKQNKTVLSVQGELGVRILIKAVFSPKCATLFGYSSPDFTWAMQVHGSEMCQKHGWHRVRLFREKKSITNKFINITEIY